MHDEGDGFFDKWFNSISGILRKSGRLEELSAKFASLRSDEERVAFGLDLDCVHDVLIVKPSYQSKSASESSMLRSEGNKLFQKNQYVKAQEMYSLSILSAPSDCEGKELSLAFANRSAVLFHQVEYEKCLEDIQQAFSYGYPEELRYKLFDRQGKCHVQLGQSAKACDSFMEAREALHAAKLKQQKKELWSNDLEREILKCQGISRASNDCYQGTVHFDKGSRLPKLTYGQNWKYISASCAVDIVMSDGLGRYPVATRDINIGDTLIIEKPFASVLLPRHMSTHCYHCLKRTATVPLPCIQCSSVRYCSEACAKESWELYHSVECKYLDLINGAGIGGNGHLALRIIIKAGLNFLKTFRESVALEASKYNGGQLGCGPDGRYCPSEYTPIYFLVTHSEERNPSDLFRRTMTAIFLLKILQDSPFFGESLQPKKDVVFIGGLILRHLQSNPCNAHEISELQLNLASVSTSETDEIAAGIYATLSLFNHSCDPSVTRNFYGDTCVVRAIRNVPKGCEISDNYGTLCALSVRSERHEKLKGQYYFTCKCQACEKEFPLYSEIPTSISPVFKCGYCCLPLRSKGKEKDALQIAFCIKCNSSFNLEKMRASLNESEDLYQQAMDSLLFGADAVNTLPVFVSYLQLLERLLCRPWKSYNNCQEAIKQCYNIMGNCHVTNSG